MSLHEEQCRKDEASSPCKIELVTCGDSMSTPETALNDNRYIKKKALYGNQHVSRFVQFGGRSGARQRDVATIHQ